MTQGEKKTRNKTQNDKQDTEETCGNAALPQPADWGKEKRKLASSSASLKAHSADVEDHQSLPVSDESDSEDIYKLPTLLSLVVQRYEGGTCEGLFHGEGVACFEGGHVYKGMFSKGFMDGYGVFTQTCGMKYEGEFVCNIPMGQGTYIWPGGSSYKGEVYNGIQHGTGTYKCAKTGISYTGQWDWGKRHGKGTVYYNQDKTSWYKGDWVKNSREGWGERRYRSGNIYSGEWKNNQRHGEGTMRWLKLGEEYVGLWQNGVQVGELVDDQMMTHNLSGNGAPIPLRAVPLLGSDSSISSDMALSIEYLLDVIPERERDTERTKVEFAVMMRGTELRSIYSFYSRLGHACSPDNTALLTRLQFWRLLKDCNIHHHGITLTQIDRFTREDDTAAEIHSPFTTILLHRFLSCLVVVAYLIYHKDMVSQKHLLVACFSKLMTDNILPNAKNVKGLLFKLPDCAVVAVNYLKKSWEVYQAYCKVSAATRDDQTMTCSHLLWLFKDLHLLDDNLTTMKLIEIITAESRDPSNLSSCLDLEITFLEFFEVLLGSTEVKCQQVSVSQEGQSLPSPKDLPEGEASEKILQTTDSPAQPEKPSDTAELSSTHDMGGQQDVEAKVNEEPQSAEQTEEPRGEGHEVQSRRMEELGFWIKTVHQFFNHFFFPAFEHYHLVSRNMKEDKLYQETHRCITLVKNQ
ncbi:radial spoke head 10 homolog B isoform X2 [Acanthopagrus latus]|uniref:radial spoke head 10 homolog B isoform X2 n=1 Tax=Acanthopagrus latus TaxID=8177 RepID=UPI00187C5312|nr:radial spoke head 10 homolog B isoform X2 [Acanthopagrus latus]